MANNNGSSAAKLIAKKPKTSAAKKDALTPPTLLRPRGIRPFPKRLVPFRHPDFTEDEIQRLTEGSHATKERLLRNLREFGNSPPDRIEGIDRRSDGGLLTVKSKSCKCGDIRDGQTSGSTSPAGDANSDGELLAAVISRLVWLEAKLSEAHNQLQGKEKIIAELEDQITIMEQARVCNEARLNASEGSSLHMQNHGHQMERFLGDCGLMLVDEDTTSSDSPSNTTEGDKYSEFALKALENLEDSFRVDYDLVIENIRDLNVLAGEGIPQIYLSSEDAKLKLIDHVPLTLYSNGIFLCGGPFRPFVDQNTRQCVRDLMDGYFPSELQRRYPNGVPLKVIDMRTVEFKEHSTYFTKNAARSAPMKTLLIPSMIRSPLPSPVSPTTSCSSSPETSASIVPHISVQKLVDSLPKSAIRDGRLIDVRNSIIQLLKGSLHSLDLIVIDTPALRTGHSTARPVTTLRIRSETGNETYLMKLFTSDTISDVRKHIDQYRSSSHLTDYNIMALYPRRVFHRPNETLEMCDLVPNAALYLRHVAAPGKQMS